MKHQALDLISLKKFLNEKCDPDTAHRLISWIYSEEAKSVIENELRAYDEIEISTDSERIFNGIIAKIQQESNADFGKGFKEVGVTDSVDRSWMNRWLAVAASIILMISTLGVIYFDRNLMDEVSVLTESEIIIKEALLGQKLTLRMSDGSIVKLNGGSKLRYNEDFGNERIVELQGEAFFDVSRDESRPFIVKGNNMEVRVLGTSFNIETTAGTKSGKVAVKSGKVQVKNLRSGETIHLIQDEVGQVEDLGGLSKNEISSPDDFFGWTENKLVFNNCKFDKVLLEIRDWFGYQIEFKSEREFDNLTGIYVNPTLNQVMESLSHSYNFEYEINDNKITIK